MPDPGYNFERLSYHSMSGFARCPRRGYLGQLLGLRERPDPGTGVTGGLAAGSVFHSILEWHYAHFASEWTTLKLWGTDGEPTVFSVDDICEYYASRDYDPAQIEIACQAYQKYLNIYGESPETDRLLGQMLYVPEMDLEADLRVLLPPKRGRRAIWYESRYDLIVKTDSGVMGVDHKLLRSFHTATIQKYAVTGQLVGYAALWNARRDLVDEHGPMQHVMVNLVFKQGRTPTHRETLPIPAPCQRDYAQVVSEVQRQIANESKRGHWPKSGMVSGECPGAFGPCRFVDVCHNEDVIDTSRYESRHPRWREIARGDGLVEVVDHLDYSEGVEP